MGNPLSNLKVNIFKTAFMKDEQKDLCKLYCGSTGSVVKLVNTVRELVVLLNQFSLQLAGTIISVIANFVVSFRVRARPSDSPDTIFSGQILDRL